MKLDVPVAIAEICVRDDVVLANVGEKWISFAVVHELFAKRTIDVLEICHVVSPIYQALAVQACLN